MQKTISLRVSEDDLKNLETIKEIYKTQKTSQIIKQLIQKEAEQIRFYTTEKHVSDKYKFKLQSQTKVIQNKRRGA